MTRGVVRRGRLEAFILFRDWERLFCIEDQMRMVVMASCICGDDNCDDDDWVVAFENGELITMTLIHRYTYTRMYNGTIVRGRLTGWMDVKVHVYACYVAL